MTPGVIRQLSAEEKKAENEYEAWLRECTEPVTEDFCRERYFILWPLIFGYFRQNMPADTEPEDATSDVFSHFMKHGKLKQQWSKDSFFRKAGQKSCDYARKAKRRVRWAEPFDEANPQHEAATAFSLPVCQSREELGEWLEEEFCTKLSRMEKKSLLMDALEDLNTDQLAKVLRKGRSQANEYLVRTKKKVVAARWLLTRDRLEIRIFGRKMTSTQNAIPLTVEETFAAASRCIDWVNVIISRSRRRV